MHRTNVEPLVHEYARTRTKQPKLSEEERLDDDPPCHYIEDLQDKSDMKVLRKSQARVAYTDKILL
jgi:hypothetical protein